MSFASPKALLNALLPRPQPETAAGVSRGGEKAAAFLRYIDGVERRGGGEPVPAFPAGAQWFNSPPLKLDRYRISVCVLVICDLGGGMLRPLMCVHTQGVPPCMPT
jgi:hypothetical protein